MQFMHLASHRLFLFATIACSVQSNILATVIEDEAQFANPGIMWCMANKNLRFFIFYPRYNEKFVNSRYVDTSFCARYLI